MKSIFVTILICFYLPSSFAQSDSTTFSILPVVRIIKTDGGELIGKIISKDAREILLLTNDDRQIYIPQHLIKQIIEVKPTDLNQRGEFVGEDKFATRYFITTNGLPIKKGEHYIQWNLFGPDFQFGVAKNFGIGIMTTWLGMPIIGTVKKSWKLSEKMQFALGGLVGTGTWAGPEWGGALPFGTFSFGTRRSNVALSGGYGAFWQNGDLDGRILSSVAGMIKVGSKISLIFDSFIFLPALRNTTANGDAFDEGLAILIPGIRWHQAEGKAIQFGFTGVYSNGELLPFPIPMVQWYRSL